ncbi:site-2 protease family protein [Candidatus Babeliales bacterium]|nr:site-2 protease family protein [Candidatus Babeliales bacterium]
MVINEIVDFLAIIATIIPVFLISISFHEFSHAFIAYLLGDDTAKNYGRLTLNPLAHLDFWGTTFFIFLRFGWARPVPVNLDNFKYPRLYSFLTSMAGPFSNFILAFLSFLLLKHFPISWFSLPIAKSLIQIFQVSASVNVMLGVFNLLPIPPLDGSSLLELILPESLSYVMEWLYEYYFYIFLALFFLPGVRQVFFRILYVLITFVENFLFSLVF